MSTPKDKDFSASFLLGCFRRYSTALVEGRKGGGGQIDITLQLYLTISVYQKCTPG